MSTIALDHKHAREAARTRRRTLRALVGGGRAGLPTLLLLLDTLAAIGFAAGLALAVSGIVEGRPAWPGALVAIAAGLARAMLAMAAGQAGAGRARDLKLRIRASIVAALLRAPPGGTRAGGESVNAAVDEVEALDGYVARFLPARQAAVFAPLIVLAATAVASPVAAMILAATLPPFIVALALAGGAAADESRRQFAALSRLSGLLADRVRAMPLVLAFGASGRETERLGAAADEVAHRTLRVLRIAFLSTGALEFFAALSVALVAVYCGFNLLGLLPFPVPETLSLGQAFFVLALAPEFYGPMRRLAAAYHDRQAAETAGERIAPLAASVAAPERPAVATDAPPSLCFRAVTIRYPESGRDAVHDFTLDIAPGETIALIGPSGAGKSSLLNLLLGLAPLSEGDALCDGRALAGGGTLAAIAAWAGQAPLLIPGSIAENVALGHRAATRADIVAAARAAGLDDAISRRRDGIDTPLDARGSGLSGGERRRIGLARALLKPAPLLLLDEPTAHLDRQAADAIIPALATAARGRTTLIATHSRAVAAFADRIVALEPVA